MRGRGKNSEILAKKSPKQPEIWLKTGRNFRNFGAFCPKFRENFLAALSRGPSQKLESGYSSGSSPYSFV